MKVGITLDEELVQRVDNYADNNYMSRSGLISLALVQYLDAAEVRGYIREMVFLLRKITDNGTVDHDTIEQLEDLERVAKLLSGSFNA